MKKIILRFIILTACVLLTLGLCSCSMVTDFLDKIVEQYEDVDPAVEEGWDFNHNGKIDEGTESIYLSFYQNWGLDMRISGHSNCDDDCEFKNGHNHNTNTNTSTNTNTNTNIIICNHQWWLTERVEPTCYTDGYQKQACSKCGKEGNEEILEASHNMQFVETIKPNCMEGGYDTYVCVREGCGVTERRRETALSFAPDAHQFIDAGSPATCIASGYNDLVCELCGLFSGNRENIPALAHTYEREDFDGVTGVVKTAPTCEENGYIVYTCTEEGCVGNVTGDGPATYTITYEDMYWAGDIQAEEYAALGHEFEYGVCTRCEETE